MGGTGAYGMGNKASWYYFQQDLANTLNRQLVTYLKTYNKDYPDLHPACKVFLEPRRKSVPHATSTSVAIVPGRLPHKLTNGTAQVHSLAAVTRGQFLKAKTPKFVLPNI